MSREMNQAGCACVIGSVTQALAAQRVLREHGIDSQVIPSDPEYSQHGCSYALSYPCGRDAVVKQVLKKAGISACGFYGGRGR